MSQRVSINKELPIWVRAPLLLGTFAVLLWLERRRPLRRTVEPKARRTGRNVTMAAVAAAALQFTEGPVIRRLSAFVASRRWGILKVVRLPMGLELPLAVVLLDYTLYLWHVLLHRVPWLWRMHIVHHIDRDLDVSTAARFHAAEMVISVFWRAGQVILIGMTPLALSVWQTLVLVSVMFHHSNVRLSIAMEQRLNRFIVTPRMHGIHHSIIEEETDSNWSSGLTLWDRLHGTLKLDIPQDVIIIGVPAYRRDPEVRLDMLLRLPFLPQRPSWRFLNGQKPVRGGSPLADSLPESALERFTMLAEDR